MCTSLSSLCWPLPYGGALSYLRIHGTSAECRGVGTCEEACPGHGDKLWPCTELHCSPASGVCTAAVAGASGGIGQPLSLLLKMNSYVDALSLYDVVGTPGVGADVGHIDSPAKVRCAPNRN